MAEEVRPNSQHLPLDRFSHPSPKHLQYVVSMDRVYRKRLIGGPLSLAQGGFCHPTLNREGTSRSTRRVQYPRPVGNTASLFRNATYHLPSSDCSASASAGEYLISDGGEAKYRDYIDSIVAQIKKVPQVQVVIELEPDAVGNCEFIFSRLGVP